MDGGTVKVSSSFTEIFDSFCPYFMSIGMSYEDYWFGDPDMAKFYKEADKFRRRTRNEEMWLQGAYFARAIATSFDKKSKYPEKPFDIFPKTAIEKQAEAEAERKKIIEHFTLLKQNWERKNGNNRQSDIGIIG